ncbi:MAG TPA: phosphoribosylanthranilate isomerase [Abditibacteriaceae bacterium]|jgi:phosphoribosylanthranilate isomerase
MTPRVLVKICGTTSVADAQLAARAGADYLGIIIDHAPSPRSVSPHTAQEIEVSTHLPAVAVTVNKTLCELLNLSDTLQPTALQLHGDESVQLVRDLKRHDLTVWVACSGSAEEIKRRALAMTDAGADAILIDARITTPEGIVYGGTGHRSDWNCARELVERQLRVILAGGLDPENVAEAIEFVRPWMVDVISGVEVQKGVKDAEKVQRFVEAARLVIAPEDRVTSPHEPGA